MFLKTFTNREADSEKTAVETQMTVKNPQLALRNKLRYDNFKMKKTSHMIT